MGDREKVLIAGRQAGRQAGICMERSTVLLTSVYSDTQHGSTLHTRIMRIGFWLSRHTWEEKMTWREGKKSRDWLDQKRALAR